MRTTETDPTVEHAGARSRAHITGRQWAQGILFLGTVVLFAAGAFLGFSLVFGLLFNRYTIHPIFFLFGWLAFRHGFTEYRNRLAVGGTATAKAAKNGASRVWGTKTRKRDRSAVKSVGRLLYGSVRYEGLCSFRAFVGAILRMKTTNLEPHAVWRLSASVPDILTSRQYRLHIVRPI
jgi:hypothetical protein